MVYHNNSLNDNNVFYEEEEAREWKQLRSQQRNDEYATSPFRRMPDEVWLIPPIIDVKLVLGDRKINMSRIEESTNTHMSYNDTEGQIEMWGTRRDLDKALMQWNTIAMNIHDDQIKYRSARKVKIWARPEKALTEKQVKKLQRREAREKEGQNLKCFPKIDFPFSSHFYFPDHEIPISRIIGEKDEFLDPIRMQTKFIGDDEDGVYEAISRVKNLYLKVFFARSIPIKRGWVYHMIEQPRMLYEVRIIDPPRWIIPPYDIVENLKRIEEALLRALQTVYLFDEEIKLHLVKYALPIFPKDMSLWSIDRLNNLVLKDTRLQSKFATCLATNFNQLKKLEEYFSSNQVWDESCSHDVSFRNGKIGLWNAVADEKNSTKSLIYTNTEDVIDTSVCEKHKEKFLWKEHFIIEITRYEYWNLEIPLQREPSENVSFGVTLYKKSWDDDFSANGNLNSGEVPEWYPDDMSNGVKQMLNDINEFLKILQNSQ
ncbi:9611_t:CDS:10, partial [Cetraspora pellucida]